MKKISLFAAFIAATAFGFTSCSDSNGGDSPSGADGEGVTAYLRVNLNPVGSAAGVASSKNFTRQATHENPGTGTYQDGTAEEGGIDNVRFYFFTNDGSAYYLADKGGEGNETINNYLDISSWTVGNTPEDLTTIERKTTGVLVINGTTEAMPAQMVALVNLDDEAKAALGEGALTKNALLQKTRTLTKYTKDGTEKKDFIMSSTAYLDGENVQQASLITSANYASTADAAKNVNPVQLYVERLAARVDVSQGTSTAWKKVTAEQSDELQGKDIYTLTTGKTFNYVDNSGATNADANKDQIYVVVKGWGLADENNNAPLSKSLDESYTNLASDAEGNTNTLTNQPLSVAQYHRSFWETANSYTPIRYTFNQYAGVNTEEKAGEGYDTNNDAYNKQLGQSAYTFPNTPTNKETGWSFTWNETNRRPSANATAQAPTKVVVAAELMYADAEGKLQPAEIGTYGGKNFLGEDGVKKAIAADVFASTNNKVCVKTTVEGTETYNPIDANDIEFVASAGPGESKSYKLTPTIKTNDGNLTTTYYTYNTTSKTYVEITSAEELNAKLKSVAGNDITIYKGGNTYYYTTLQHLWFPSNFTLATDAATNPTNAGAWGVVRNHLYKVTLNTIAGWGTPVYNPEEIIIPVTPSDNESYLGAQINVLMWRVVNNEVDLDGTPANN